MGQTKRFATIQSSQRSGACADFPARSTKPNGYAPDLPRKPRNAHAVRGRLFTHTHTHTPCGHPDPSNSDWLREGRAQPVALLCGSVPRCLTGGVPSPLTGLKPDLSVTAASTWPDRKLDVTAKPTKPRAPAAPLTSRATVRRRVPCDAPTRLFALLRGLPLCCLELLPEVPISGPLVVQLAGEVVVVLGPRRTQAVAPASAQSEREL